MPTKKVTIGSFGPYPYDDTYSFSSGQPATSMGGDGIIAADQMTLGSDPTDPMH